MQIAHAPRLHTSHPAPAPPAQACIDQLNIDASLACLPIFLSGCKKLLMLVGSTYVTRLWVRQDPMITLPCATNMSCVIPLSRAHSV